MSNEERQAEEARYAAEPTDSVGSDGFMRRARRPIVWPAELVRNAGNRPQNASPRPVLVRVAPDAPNAPVDIRGLTSQVAATDVSTLLLPADPKRTFLFIQNNDALGFANIAFGVDATLAIGMRLSSGGGGILLDNHVPTANIYIIGNLALNPNITMVVG